MESYTLDELNELVLKGNYAEVGRMMISTKSPHGELNIIARTADATAFLENIPYLSLLELSKEDFRIVENYFKGYPYAYAKYAHKFDEVNNYTALLARYAITDNMQALKKIVCRKGKHVIECNEDLYIFLKSLPSLKNISEDPKDYEDFLISLQKLEKNGAVAERVANLVYRSFPVESLAYLNTKSIPTPRLFGESSDPVSRVGDGFNDHIKFLVSNSQKTSAIRFFEDSVASYPELRHMFTKSFPDFLFTFYGVTIGDFRGDLQKTIQEMVRKSPNTGDIIRFRESAGIPLSPKLKSFFYSDANHHHKKYLLEGAAATNNNFFSGESPGEVANLVNYWGSLDRFDMTLEEEYIVIRNLQNLLKENPSKELEKAIKNISSELMQEHIDSLVEGLV